jgi:hypothetical protein
MSKKPMRRGLPPAAGGIPAPADKRFRRSDARPTRKKSWRTVARRFAVLAAAALLAGVTLVWGANTFMDAGRFRINSISVHGTTYLAADEVRALVKGIEGQSIFRVKLDEFQLRVADNPWVSAATLRRRVPVHGGHRHHRAHASGARTPEWAVVPGRRYRYHHRRCRAAIQRVRICRSSTGC